VFRTVGDQPSLWESILPEEVRRLPEELARVDALLDDSRVFRPVRAVLRSAGGSALDTDGNLSAVDVFEVPLPAGLREPVPGGVGFDHLAEVLPDPAGWVGAASDHVDEADHPLRVGGGGWAQRGPVGQGGRGETVTLQPDPCGHHGGGGERCLSHRLRAAGQVGAPDRGD
jgi:IS5 family transposase